MGDLLIKQFDSVHDLFYYFEVGRFGDRETKIQRWFKIQDLGDEVEVTWVLDPYNYLIDNEEVFAAKETFKKAGLSFHFEQALTLLRFRQ